MARIFVSHSSTDNAAAIALGDWLAAEGWDDFFLDLSAARGIAAGELWERRLHEEANRCEAVVFLISRAWLASQWCVRELTLADKLNKQIFGVLIEDIPVADLPADLTATRQVVNLAAGKDHRIFTPELPDGSEGYVLFSQGGLARLREGLMRAGLDARHFAWPPEDDPERPPYRGLVPMEAEDAGIFYGREAPTIAVLDRLRGLVQAAPPRLLAIVGASGAGKSSFLRAGLAPRLRRDDRNFLMLPILRPERAALFGEDGLVRVLEAAAKSLGLAKSRADIRAAVQEGAGAVSLLLAAFASAASPPDTDGTANRRAPRLVLAIDQGEELFLAEGQEEASAFLALMRDLASAPESDLIVLFTIRSDSFERLQTAPALEGLNPQTFSLPPMPRGAYQTVIEGPAKRLADSDRALTIEPALTAALLADIEAGGGKDALPLLAFTLERLYVEYGGGGALTLAQYRDLGGISGSIEAAVERALDASGGDPAVPRDHAARLVLLRRALIPWLAGIDPESGSPRRRVARLSEIPEEARPLVGYLIAARLLSTDVAPETGERTVEPAHEALLRQWGLLQGWLEEDFAALTTLAGIQRAARDWAANAKDEAWLAHTAGRLEDAEGVARRDDFVGLLEATDRDYLAAARAADDARRNHELEEARQLAAAQKKVAQRTRLGLIAASLLLVAAAGAAVFGFQKADEARQQAAVAQAQTARAQRAVTAATDAGNTLVVDLARKFRNTRGVPASLVKSILDPAIALQNKLIDAGERDVRLYASQSAALNEAVGALLTVGDTQGALAAAEKSTAIMRMVLEQASSKAFWKAGLAESLVNVGDVKLQAGDRIGARAAYEESLALRRDLAADDGGVLARRALSESLDRVGNMALAANDFAHAIDLYGQSLAIARDLAKSKGNVEGRRDLAISLAKMGDAKLGAGDRAGALASYEEALAISRDLAKNANNAQAQRDLLVNLESVADVKDAAGDNAGALAAYEEGLAIARDLAVDKSNAAAQRDLSLALDRFGGAKQQTGDQASALSAFEESLAIARSFAADRSNMRAQRFLSFSLDKVAAMKRKAGDLKSALVDYGESLAIARRLAEDSGDKQAQRDLSISLSNLGDVKRDAGDRVAARALFEESLTVTRKLAEADSNSRAQLDLAVVLNRIAEVSDDPMPQYEEEFHILQTLDAQGLLPAYDKDLLKELSGALADIHKADATGAAAK